MEAITVSHAHTQRERKRKRAALASWISPPSFVVFSLLIFFLLTVRLTKKNLKAAHVLLNQKESETLT
jgi:type VI protein secretion system component VasF